STGRSAAPRPGFCLRECRAPPTPDTTPHPRDLSPFPSSSAAPDRNTASSPRSAGRPTNAPVADAVRRRAAYAPGPATLLFLGGLGEGRVGRRLGQQTGDQPIGHPRKGLVNLLLQLRELARILFQRLQPRWRIGLQTSLNLGQYTVDAADHAAGLAPHANVHDVRPPCQRISNHPMIQQSMLRHHPILGMGPIRKLWCPRKRNGGSSSCDRSIPLEPSVFLSATATDFDFTRQAR